METPEHYESLIPQNDEYMSRGVIATMALASSVRAMSHSIDKAIRVQALTAVCNGNHGTMQDQIKASVKLVSIALGEEE